MRRLLWSLVFATGCALPIAQMPAQRDPVAEVPNPHAELVTPDGGASVETSGLTPETGSDDPADIEGEEEEEDAAVPEEGEAHVEGSANEGIRYTTDLSDEVLAEKWKASPEALGSISIGFVDEGRLVNSMQFPRGDGTDYLVVSPERAWATKETIDFVLAAIRAVREQHPNAPPLRVNQISQKEGGYSRPHKSHQNGRDVDLGFYYPTVNPIRVRERERVINVALNWALVKALVTHGDVQFILVDKRVQAVLYKHALSIGEDKAWLDSLFHAGKDSILKHARRHRDHFHVRFYNARAQELGRRIAPLLAQRPEHNIATHRVRSGDTLGAIARKYNSSIARIRKANRMKSSFLRLRQVLRIPLRGPCTRCPVPGPQLVPPRRLPPQYAKTGVPPVGTVAKAEVAKPAQVIPARATAAITATAAVAPAPVVPAESGPHRALGVRKGPFEDELMFHGPGDDSQHSTGPSTVAPAMGGMPSSGASH
jgi:LysM repeat protein/murein endopeptidase